MSSRLSLAEGATWVRLVFEGPVLELAVLGELTATLDELARRRPPKPLILASAHPSIFLAGAHLGEIATLDARSSVAYADRGRAVMRRLETHPKATIAAVNGSCSGGGFDLALACDVVIAGPSAVFSHPGVRRGLVTGWGGTVRLPSAVGPTAAQRALLLAAELTADDAAELGIALRSSPDVVGESTDLASRLMELHPDRLAAWRLLRDRSGTSHCGRLRHGL